MHASEFYLMKKQKTKLNFINFRRFCRFQIDFDELKNINFFASKTAKEMTEVLL